MFVWCSIAALAGHVKYVYEKYDDGIRQVLCDLHFHCLYAYVISVEKWIFSYIAIPSVFRSQKRKLKYPRSAKNMIQIKMVFTSDSIGWAGYSSLENSIMSLKLLVSVSGSWQNAYKLIEWWPICIIFWIKFPNALTEMNRSHFVPARVFILHSIPYSG